MEIIEQNKHFCIAVGKIHDLEFYNQYLNIPEIQKVQNIFSSYQRKCEWLNTHYLLHQLTGTIQTYRFNENNKPIASASHHFLSISHCEDYSAIALSKSTSIGIDIEKHGRNFIRIARKFLHPNETKLSADNNTCHLIWCAKEALYKLLDCASPNFSADYETSNIQFEENTIFIKYKNQNIYRIYFLKTSEYLLTWTAKI